MYFRERFPILEKKTYLASHSLGAVPRATEESLRRYYSEWANLGINAWDGPWWEKLSEFSGLIERVLGAEPGTVAPMENVTRGFAAIASALDWKAKAPGGGMRNKILLTDLEFLTSYPFWRGWAELVGARLVVVESEDGVHLPAEKIAAAIDEETLIVPTSQVYFRSGTLQDLAAISRAAHAKGALVLGDGYQAAGCVPIDVQALGVDFYVGGSHKWLCGGPGAGYLYVSPKWVSKLRPGFAGWFGIRDSFAYSPTTEFEPAEDARRFVAGTPAVPALYAAIEGVKTMLEVGPEKIRAHSLRMTEAIIREADRRGLDVKTPRDPAQRSGMVCIDFPGAKETTERLGEAGVIVDYRPNCGIRVSPHFYNDERDLEVFWRKRDQFASI